MKKSKTLADLRTKAGVTQRDAAEKLAKELGRDIRPPHVARWESGAIEPRLSVVVAMAAVYGCSIADVADAALATESGRQG